MIKLVMLFYGCMIGEAKPDYIMYWTYAANRAHVEQIIDTQWRDKREQYHCHYYRVETSNI